ncbi:Uncharacterized protein APZ42_002219, partial [Daphnia magna]
GLDHPTKANGLCQWQRNRVFQAFAAQLAVAIPLHRPARDQALSGRGHQLHALQRCGFACGGEFGQSQLGLGVSSRTGHTAGSQLVHQSGCEEGLHPYRCLFGRQQHRAFEGGPRFVCGRLGLPFLSPGDAVCGRANGLSP